MMKARIKLAFRIVIDSNSALLWDKYVFDDTFFEYKIQHQVYDDKDNPVKNYWELLQKNPNAQNIKHRLSAVVSPYVEQLGSKITSITDILGTTAFPIEDFEVDLISSNLEDTAKHKIGITFKTPELALIDIIDNKFLLSRYLFSDAGYETFMLPFHPQVAICHWIPAKAT